jgi:hypothetical protein
MGGFLRKNLLFLKKEAIRRHPLELSGCDRSALVDKSSLVLSFKKE